MGAAIDVDIGEILDYLLYDPNTHSILLYLEGHSHDEMAEITGLTVTNVATKISRIKEKLRRAFATAAEQENDHGTR